MNASEKRFASRNESARCACARGKKRPKLGMSNDPQASGALLDANTHEALPNRPQRRYLRRVFNGRTDPMVIGGEPFLNYKQASAYLKGKTFDECESFVASVKSFLSEK